MRTSIKLSELPTSIMEQMNEYNQRDLSRYQALKADFEKFYPLEIYAEVEGERVEYFFTRMVDHPTIQVSPPNYQKKINIYDSTRYNTDQKFKGVEPNLIGVLSKRKIDDWVKYYAERADFLNDAVRVKEEKIAAFTLEFEKAGGTLKESYQGGIIVGEIVRGGLEYTVKIHQPSGYIEQRIEKHYRTGSDIGTFLKLADNKYTAAQQ